MSMATRNLKLNELKEEIKRVSSALNDDENQDDEDKSMLCIGNKYLNSNLLSATSITPKSASTSNLELINGEIAPNSNNNLQVEAADFEKAISQSHLSPSASFTNFSKKLLSAVDLENSQENLTNLLKSAPTSEKTPKSDVGDENQDIQSPFTSNTKRKDHSKISKKSTLKVLSAVGVNLNDIQNDDEDTTTVDFDDPTTDNNHSSLVLHKLTSKKKQAVSRKKSSHNSHRKSGVKHSPKKSAALKSSAAKSQELS